MCTSPSQHFSSERDHSPASLFGINLRAKLLLVRVTVSHGERQLKLLILRECAVLGRCKNYTVCTKPALDSIEHTAVDTKTETGKRTRSRGIPQCRTR
jgi:hypothetical protein